MSIILITPFYIEQNPVRKRELDQALAQNVVNKQIDKIVLAADETVPEMVMPFEKVVIHKLGKRAMYSDLFYQVAPFHATEDDIVIFSNSDIAFDDSLTVLKSLDWSRGIALACTRWDKENGEWKIIRGVDSQDFWVFKGEIKPMFSSFRNGLPGADNRIAFEMDRVSYWVFNAAQSIVGKHIHESGVRHYIKNGQITEKVADPYLTLPIINADIIKRRKGKKLGYIGLPMNLTDAIEHEQFSEFTQFQYIDWLRYADRDFKLVPKFVQKFNEDCLRLAASSDIVFMQLQTDNIVTPALAQQMSKHAKLLNYTGDVRHEIPNCFWDIAPWCTTIFTNADDVEEFKKKGFNSEWMQVIFSNLKYSPKGHKESKHDIVFMGNNYWGKEVKHKFPLGKERQDMAVFLKENYGDRFGLYGFGWDGLEDGDLGSDWYAEASIYRGAKIGINYSQFNRSRYTSDRLFRIMGCGCLALSHQFKDMWQDFGKEHLVSFDSLEYLKHQIDYYLENEEERKKIAEAGCSYVHRTQSSKNFYKKIIELLC